MKLAYIIGPYRAATTEGIQANIDRARAMAVRLWQAGYAVICPHMNTAHFDGVVSDEVFLAGDLEMLGRCDVAVVLNGWEDSCGSCRELVFARRNRIEVIFEDGLE